MFGCEFDCVFDCELFDCKLGCEINCKLGVDDFNGFGNFEITCEIDDPLDEIIDRLGVTGLTLAATGAVTPLPLLFRSFGLGGGVGRSGKGEVRIWT